MADFESTLHCQRSLRLFCSARKWEGRYHPNVCMCVYLSQKENLGSGKRTVYVYFYFNQCACIIRIEI